MISRTLLALAVVAMSVGSANAVTYYATQGERSDETAVAAERSVVGNAYDGDASTFFSLGVNQPGEDGKQVYGGSLTADVSPLRIASGSVVEITNSTPNKTYPESAEIWLGGSIIDDAWDSSGAVLFGEIFNEDPSDRQLTFDSAFGSITMTGQGGTETAWELTLNSDAVYSLITLRDTTLINYSSKYGDGTDGRIVTDGFDVGEFRVAAIPLPASVLMLLGALGGLGFVSRRRHADA